MDNLIVMPNTPESLPERMTFFEWENHWAEKVNLIRMSNMPVHLADRRQVWIAHVAFGEQIFEAIRWGHRTENSHVTIRLIDSESASQGFSNPPAA
jgi:hypothetical protein